MLFFSLPAFFFLNLKPNDLVAPETRPRSEVASVVEER
jgi:hypothetical protein